MADHYYFDSLGSTVMMTEGLSTITDLYDYDAWGNEYPIMVSTLDNPYRYVGQLGYYTHWMEPSLTDLLHLGVRFYEPGVGRFGQVDRIPMGNLFVYAHANPSLLVDPSGDLATPVNARAAEAFRRACIYGGAPPFTYLNRGYGHYSAVMWCRTTERVNKWKFIKCLGIKCAPTVAKASWCVASCTRTGPAFLICWINCMGQLDPNDGTTPFDVVECYNEAKYSAEEVYEQGVCTIDLYGPVYMPGPVGKGWKRCNDD
ncbi:MAG: hypothetical protein K6U00_04225 [Armatimonadetes bacterium]|nr:hypothetical protein [Armatimonadota bacterium]